MSDHDEEVSSESQPEAIANPQAVPMDGESLLLAPRTRSASDFIVPGLIGVAGITLLYFAFRKEKKPEPSQKLIADDDSVVFSKSFKNYAVGKGWVDEVLEPYLAYQAEEGTLITDSNYGAIPIASLPGSLKTSRKKALSAFKKTTSVTTSSGEVLISNLPSDREGVKSFNAWLESTTKQFQEDN